jgi:hypothetical protein
MWTICSERGLRPVVEAMTTAILAVQPIVACGGARGLSPLGSGVADARRLHPQRPSTSLPQAMTTSEVAVLVGGTLNGEAA